MSGPFANTSESIDGKTSRSIRDAVGERLQQDLRPQTLAPSPYLQRLLEEMRRRDREAEAKRQFRP
ncbi:MAG: hypothetical protein JOY90_10660 [Bradyrhizobium sp.]|uniref:hypothetical protein n=1 Tax=Bradyrhizobium sp. TaxID=376 RepID=UPI001D7CDEBA|nr:hypothetical protein [Bradyrhizobium sp.]MBV9560902.1 hypothetical protein [Bradyrhizobium sp.]